MVKNSGFLGRIDQLADGKPGSSPRAGVHKIHKRSAEIEGVIDHLNKLFNTRQGSSMCCKDYGLPDFNSLAAEFPDMIQELRDIVLRQIIAYEPRLHSPNVTHIPNPDDPTSLVFSISGDIASNSSSRSRTSFHVNLSDGMVKIR